MPTATQDDLLIIQAETDTSGDDFSFNFDFDESTKEQGDKGTQVSELWEKESQKESNSTDESAVWDDIIDMDNTSAPLSQEITWEEWENNGAIIEESKEKTQDSGFSIDLWDELIVEETTDNNSKDEKSDDKSGDINNSESDIFSLDVEEKNTSTSLQDKNEDLNTILTGTIKKLQDRKKSIWDNTEAKKKKSSELRQQIEWLENEVSTIEAEIATLWLESDKIDINISQLESMKLDPVKEHNSRRTSKK